MIWLTLIKFLNKLKFFWHSASRDGNFAPYFDNDLCSLPNRNSLTLSVQDVQLKMFLDSADYFFRIVLSIFKYRYIPHSKEMKLLLLFLPVDTAMRILKVSKFQKQIILSSHSPKNQQKFSHFFAQASKKP